VAGGGSKASKGPPRAGDLRRNVISPMKLKEKFGWEPQFLLKNGLADTLKFFKSLSAYQQ